MEDKRYIVGADLGGTNVRAAVSTFDGKLLGEGRRESKAMEGLPVTVGQIVMAIREAIDNAEINLSQVVGVGMGVPGQHKSAEGIVLWSPNFSDDWNGGQLLAPISESLGGVPCYMGNDVNVAALGEFTFGAGKEVNSLVMMTLGTGIGGGVIIDGKLIAGTSEGGGEIGHMAIIAGGSTCTCGRHGHLEGLAGRDAIIARAMGKIETGIPSILGEWTNYDPREITPALIAKAAGEGDRAAIETLEETGYYIGIAASNAINLLNPEMVVIGGGISQAGEVLWGPIRRTARANALTASWAVCKIVPASLGDDAGIMGGVTLVLRAMGK